MPEKTLGELVEEIKAIRKELNNIYENVKRPGVARKIASANGNLGEALKWIDRESGIERNVDFNLNLFNEIMSKTVEELETAQETCSNSTKKQVEQEKNKIIMLKNSEIRIKR